MKTINCNQKLIDLSTPKVMGILNLTPDSFYDGGKLSSDHKIIEQAGRMLEDGATFLDIGGYSSRPGAKFVSEEEELQRVIPTIRLLIKEFPNAILSIDTFRSNVAQQGLELGAAIINDISAGKIDEQMMLIVAKHNAPYIMMHMQGTPENMMDNTNYSELTKDILYYFSERIAKARSFGINDILIDPGFGFSKTTSQNFQLLNELELFSILELPILIGISRKSMIYKTLGITSSEAINGTTALHAISLLKGASILRVHDVKEAVETINLYQNLKSH